jgi:hypothetical protein
MEPKDRFSYLGTGESDAGDDDDDPNEMDIIQSSIFDEVNTKIVCRIIWIWYNDVRRREKKDRTFSMISISRFFFWVAFVRIFYISTKRDEELDELYSKSSVTDFEYYNIVGTQYNIRVTQSPLSEYSITDLWDSIRLVYYSLYTFPFSIHMKTYLYALFYRYATLISCAPPSNISEERIDELCDNPIFVEHERYDLEGIKSISELLSSFKRMTIPAPNSNESPSYLLNNLFVFEGETLFYHQIFRCNLSQSLASISLQCPLVVNYNRELVQGHDAIDAWSKFVSDTGSDNRLRRDVIDDFRLNVVGIHLYHGEKERYRETYPELGDSDREIIVELRPNDIIGIDKIQLMPIYQIIEEYSKSLKSQREKISTTGPLACELEAILLTRIVTKYWYDMNETEMGDALFNSILLDEQTDLYRFDIIINLMKKRLNAKQQQQQQQQREGQPIPLRSYINTRNIPLLVKLMRIYYVITCDQEILVTESFIEAYCVWTALSVKVGAIPANKLFNSMRLTVLKIMDSL